MCSHMHADITGLNEDLADPGAASLACFWALACLPLACGDGSRCLTHSSFSVGSGVCTVASASSSEPSPSCLSFKPVAFLSVFYFCFYLCVFVCEGHVYGGQSVNFACCSQEPST